MNQLGRINKDKKLNSKSPSFYGKVQFRTFKAVDRLDKKLRYRVQIVDCFKKQSFLPARSIAVLPQVLNNKLLLIDGLMVDKIMRSHGDFASENLILTANKPTHLVIINGGQKINLVKQFGENSYFILGANKINGYYTVTFFEPENKHYILKRVFKRGDLIDLTGRPLSSSFATSPIR